MSEGTTLIQFRAGELADGIAQRRDHGQSATDVARRDLARYYAVLAAELASTVWLPGEVAALRDALNGSLLDTTSYRLLWAEIDDALADGLAAKWDVDGPALVAKLRVLTPAQAMAVIDGAERYWAAVARGETPPPDVER